MSIKRDMDIKRDIKRESFNGPTGFTSRLRKREKKSTVLLREQRLLKQMQLEEAVDAEAAALPEDPPEEPEEEEDSKLPARSPTVNYEEEDDLQEEKKKTIASIANIFDLSNRRSFCDTVKQVCRWYGDRKGRRHIPRSQLGGKRVRTLAEDCYDKGKIELHEDAALAPAAIIQKTELKFETQEELDNE
eukprot:jgi/Psemu1/51579/gm1.51579_g